MEALKTIKAGGKTFRVEPGRKILVVQATITSTADGEATFEAPEDMLVETITAWSEDAGGLETCRIGWKSDSGRDIDFYAPEKDSSIRYPVASTVFSNADNYRQERWNLVFPKSKKRVFIFQNNGGSPSYEVELTFSCRILTEVP